MNTHSNTNSSNTVRLIQESGIYQEGDATKNDDICGVAGDDDGDNAGGDID